VGHTAEPASVEEAVAGIKAFELDALEREQAGGPAYREFLRLPGASPGLFHDITEDLRVLVIFAPPAPDS
jgi:hypothetical protein